MASTPSFNWSTPDNTGLVKNGALDIRTLGNAIDASMTDLLGGTTGQVLKKNSNTDMDFVWSADSAGMTNPMTTTGDTIYSSSGSTPARLGIGSTGQVLTVSGGVPTWATPAGGGGGKVLQVVTASYNTEVTVASTSATDTGLTATITPTLSTSKIMVVISQPYMLYRDSTDIGLRYQIVRGATNIVDIQGQSNLGLKFNAGVGAGSGVQGGAVLSYSYLDSPATTSATTYKTTGSVYTTASGGKVYFQMGSASASQIILMEIGA